MEESRKRREGSLNVDAVGEICHKFRYDPYQLPEGHIRLLQLERKQSHVNGEIHGSLTAYPLQQAPPYIAISYQCGTDVPLHVLNISDTRFSVKQNLHDVLSMIWRRLGEDVETKGGLFDTGMTRFWVDAISINQQDLAERDAQVQMMGAIFARANLVLVWLGKDITDRFGSLKAYRPLEFVEEAATWSDPDTETDIIAWSKEHLLVCQGNYDDGTGWHPYGNKHGLRWQALLAILNLSYWKRAWIVQEILVAQKIMLCFDTEALPWHLWSRFFELLDISKSASTSSPKDFIAKVWRQTKMKWTEMPFTVTYNEAAKKACDSVAYVMLLTRQQRVRAVTERQLSSVAVEQDDLRGLLLDYHQTQCQRSEDRIYSLLGLTSNPRQIRVNYASEREAIYAEVILAPSSTDHSVSMFWSHVLADALEIPYIPKELTRVEDVGRGSYTRIMSKMVTCDGLYMGQIANAEVTWDSEAIIRAMKLLAMLKEDADQTGVENIPRDLWSVALRQLLIPLPDDFFHCCYEQGKVRTWADINAAARCNKDLPYQVEMEDPPALSIEEGNGRTRIGTSASDTVIILGENGELGRASAGVQAGDMLCQLPDSSEWYVLRQTKDVEKEYIIVSRALVVQSPIWVDHNYFVHTDRLLAAYESYPKDYSMYRPQPLRNLVDPSDQQRQPHSFQIHFDPMLMLHLTLSARTRAPLDMTGPGSFPKELSQDVQKQRDLLQEVQHSAMRCFTTVEHGEMLLEIIESDLTDYVELR